MITASLVSGSDPRLVQLIIDETPAGVPWRVVGRVGSFTAGLAPGSELAPSATLAPKASEFVASDYSWQVPGGFGVGDGEQLALVDNRSPGNVTVVYYLVTGDGTEASEPVTVVFPTDVVLQSNDGQAKVSAELLADSTDIELPTNVASFRVPGRPRPVTRYDVLGDVVSTLNVLLPVEETTPFKDLLGPGKPVLVRFGRDVLDLDRVAVIQITRVSSSRVLQQKRKRVWSLDYLIVDDPWIDERLGAFTWDDFRAAFEGRTWDDFREAFAGKTWDGFATADWTVV